MAKIVKVTFNKKGANKKKRKSTGRVVKIKFKTNVKKPKKKPAKPNTDRIIIPDKTFVKSKSSSSKALVKGTRRKGRKVGKKKRRRTGTA